jgi:hypothetical protein
MYALSKSGQVELYAAKVAIGFTAYEAADKAAKERQRESKGRGKRVGKLPTPIKGRAADKAAKATGIDAGRHQVLCRFSTPQALGAARVPAPKP